MRSVFVFFFIHLCESILAQDTLQLMNGHRLPCDIVSDSGTVFVFELTKKNGKVKTRELHKNDVFSVIRNGQPEFILYEQNEFIGDIYSVDEMRYLLAGQGDARNNFKAWPTFIGGFVLCGAIAFIGQDGYIMAVTPPIAYMVAQLIPKIKIRESYMSNPEYKNNDIYADGFEPPARSRKMLRALGGGFAGSATGVITWFLFFNK
jgi:hypothetical protein